MALPQYREDLVAPGQCFRQPAEVFVDLLLDRLIDADIGGQTGHCFHQLFGPRYQHNIAIAEPLQRLDFATLALPNLVVGRHCGAAQPGIDLEDAVGDGTEVLRRRQMLRIGVRALTGRRRQILSPIAPFEVAQSRRSPFEVFAGPRADQQSSARIWLSQRYQL